MANLCSAVLVQYVTVYRVPRILGQLIRLHNLFLLFSKQLMSLTVFLLSLDAVDFDQPLVNKFGAFENLATMVLNIWVFFDVELHVIICAVVKVRRLSHQHVAHVIDHKLLSTIK